MPLISQTLNDMGSGRPYPGQLWRRDRRQVITVAVSDNTVTYDDLTSGGRATESLDAFLAVFRRVKR